MTRLLAVLLAALPLCAADARLTFTKSFPGSVPEYVYVSVDHSGAMEYKEALSDDQPVKAQLKDPQLSELFQMARQLDFFKASIESGLKVANTGKKTFRYQDENGTVTETVFNYSVIPVAEQLLDRFEQIAATERAYQDLDRTVHFDKLGVNDSLAEIESMWLKKQLAAPEQFLPLLTRVATHESFMHLARDRAARLKEAFIAPPQTEQAAK